MIVPPAQWLRWLPAARFASLTGIPRRTVHYWCSRGRIPAVRKFGNRRLWYIDMRRLAMMRRDAGDDSYNELVIAVAALRRQLMTQAK